MTVRDDNSPQNVARRARVLRLLRAGAGSEDTSAGRRCNNSPEGNGTQAASPAEGAASTTVVPPWRPASV